MDARVNPWMSKDVYDSFDVYQMNFGLARIYDPVGIHVSAPEIVSILRKLVEALSPDLVHFKHIKGFSVAAISEIRKLHIPVFFSATDYWTICPRTNLIKTAGQELCQGPKNPAQCLQCYLPYLPAWGAEIALKLTSQKAGEISGKMASLYSLKHRVRALTEHINESNKIFVSTLFLARLLEEYGVKKHLIRVVPYGVRLGNLPARISVPISFTPEQPLKIAFIGTLTRIKGAHVFLEAIRLLTNVQLENLSVYVYGKINSGETDYEGLLKNLSETSKNVINFMGTFPHEEIGKVLRSVHLVVVPLIWYESAPLVLCSALAAGVPVLVSKLGGMTEIIQEVIDGFSFTAGDSTQLSALISKLLDTPEWFREISNHSGNKISTPEDYANDIEAEYLRVLAAG